MFFSSSNNFLIIAILLLTSSLCNHGVNGTSSPFPIHNQHSKRWTENAEHFLRRHRISDLEKRQAAGQTVPTGVTVVQPPAGVTLAEQIISQAASNPVGASELVQQIPYIADNSSGITETQYQLVSGDSNEAQLPWNSQVPFIQGAATTENAAGGWQILPEVQGFTLNRTWEIVPGAIMPFYSTSGLDPAQIKRAVITFPGQPRDAWLYATLYSNALEVVYYNQTYGVAKDSVLVISPFWGNQLDSAAGALRQNELYFEGDGWMAGEDSIGPNLQESLTSYSIMDNFTDMLFDKNQFPNLNQVVIAGHSMGGQAAQKYALLKRPRTYDPNMSYWVGNPGSWAYLSADRPYNNASCTATFNTWEYGLGGDLMNMTKYARDEVAKDVDGVVKTYINRNVHYALGLLDNGPGDTHCEALDQGGNHLDRGSQFAIHLYEVNNNAWPASQTVDFIGNTSHQDFAMISANSSIYWMFVNDYNTAVNSTANGGSSSSGGSANSQAKQSSHKNQAPTIDRFMGYSILITFIIGLISIIL